MLIKVLLRRISRLVRKLYGRQEADEAITEAAWWMEDVRWKMEDGKISTEESKV